MTIKLIFMALAGASIAVYDRPGWKKAGSREKWLYSLLLIIIAYLGCMFAFDADWPNLDELMGYFFAAPSARLFSLLTGEGG